MFAIKWLWRHSFSVIAILAIPVFASGCDNSNSIPRPLNVEKLPQRQLWADGSDEARGGRDRVNFYVAYPDKYPRIGLVHHFVDAPMFSDSREKLAVHDAIAIARRHFSAAYASEEILEWDDRGRHKKLWKNGSRAIPFSPEWVVVIVENISKLAASPDGSVTPEMQREQIIEVGYLFPANALFDVDVSVEKLVSLGFRDKKPVQFDFSKEAAIDRTEYLIVDRFFCQPKN